MNYKESAVTGTRWTRAVEVKITNYINQTPTLSFREENVIQLGDNISIERSGYMPEIVCSFDPTLPIPLINPETGKSLNKLITHEELYVILHSLYIQQATLRDKSQALREAQAILEDNPGV